VKEFSRDEVNLTRGRMSYSVMGRCMLAVAALFCAGCGSVSDNERPADAPVVSIQPAEVTTEIVGASPEQERVLLEILAGLGPTDLERVEIGKPEHGWSKAPGAVALVISARKKDTLALWHGYLVAQAFQERSRELGLPPIAYRADFGSTSAPGRPPEGPSISEKQAQHFVKALRAAAARNGAEVRRIEILKPRRFAFRVELQADDVAAFLLNNLDDALAPISQLRGQGFDGRYVNVVDKHGTWALTIASDHSGGTGGVRPDLAGCKWIGLSVPVGWSPPPCPAEESK
jgi:hypothetical protein